MQTLFSRGPSATLRMLVLVGASIALMTIDHRWNHLEVVRSALSTLLYPLQYTIDLPIRFYYWSDEVFSTHQTLLEKNREYEARHLENRVQLQKLDILEKENTRLRKLLSATPKTTERLLIAEIINVDVDPYRQLIVLNKSKSNGVYAGQPIIDAQGVMGQIIHVGPLSSTAILITDASHAIPVQVDRNGLRTIAFGTGNINELAIRNLTHNADIREGDTLITSGLGGHFPPNYPVAVVTKVERPAGERFARVTARPLALLNQSREVLLLWNNKPQAAEEAIDETETDSSDSGETGDKKTVVDTAASNKKHKRGPQQ